MAHAQKPDFVFRRNGRVHFNLPWGASVQSTTGSRCVRISGSNPGYTTFRGSVKSTGYPLHSPVSPSLPLPASPCAITFQLDSNTPPALPQITQQLHVVTPLASFFSVQSKAHFAFHHPPPPTPIPVPHCFTLYNPFSPT